MISKLLQDIKARYLTEHDSEAQQFNFRIVYALNKLSDRQSLFTIDPSLKLNLHGVGSKESESPNKLDCTAFNYGRRMTS